MNPQVINITSEVIAKLKTLAPQQQQQVLGFVEFLANKYTHSQEAPQQRVPDLNKGQIWISDEFDNALPDEFWLGKGII